MSEDHASDAQIKRLYAVLHSINLDPKAWKKEQGFDNYAKLSQEQCSEYIDQLELLEAEKKAQFQKDTKNGTQKQFAPISEVEDMIHLEEMMRFAMRAANAIVDDEISSCGSDSMAAQIKQKTGVTIFLEATRRGL